MSNQKKHTLSSSLFNPFWEHEEYDADHAAAAQISCPICLKIIQAKTTPSYLSGCKIGDNKHRYGYFGFEDYTPCIEAIKNNKCCPAHTKRSNRDDGHNEIITELEATLDEIEKVLNDSEFQKYFKKLIKKLQATTKDESFNKEIESLKIMLSVKEKKYKELYNKICNLDKKSGSLLLHLPNFSKDVIHRLQSDQDLWDTILENEKRRREVKLLPESCNATIK